MQFSVGYQFTDGQFFSEIILKHKQNISELYFPWINISDGRGLSISDKEDQKLMEDELEIIHDHGVKLNLLLNSNCYGEKSVSNELKKEIVGIIEYLLSNIGLETITTTSLFVAAVVKKEFPKLELRASVNMNIQTIEGMEYIKDYFDSFYIGRENNRDIIKVKETAFWCHDNDKKVYILANSGCLRNCSAHIFHNNLVSHEYGISARKDKIMNFYGICWKYIKGSNSIKSLIEKTTWIRPEDISLYENIVDGIKLATRTNRDPEKVITSYINQKFSGNILSLCEPDFSSLRYIDNEIINKDLIW